MEREEMGREIMEGPEMFWSVEITRYRMVSAKKPERDKGKKRKRTGSRRTYRK